MKARDTNAARAIQALKTIHDDVEYMWAELAKGVKHQNIIRKLAGLKPEKRKK